MIDCPHRIPPSGTPVTHHKAWKVIMPDWAWGTSVKIQTGKANPDHSPTTEDIAAQVIAFHAEATVDYNTGIDVATTEAAHDELAQPTWDTQPQTLPWHTTSVTLQTIHTSQLFRLSILRLQKVRLTTILLIIKAWVTQIRFILQQDKKKATSQEEHEGKDRRPTHWLLQLKWSLQWLGRGIRFFKLIELSPSSNPSEQAGIPSSNQVTVALIMDCPSIIVHAGKHYRALTDSGVVISLIRYSTYQAIDSSSKMAIQATMTKLNTADGSPMTALGMMVLQLWIEDFKFAHNFITCDRLPDMELLFGIDIQKKFSLSYVWDKEKNCYIQRDSKFLTYTRNCEQKATIGIVKSTLKIPPRHNGIIPINIKGHIIKGHIAYFISDQDSTKWKDLNINIINGIHNIKGKTSVNILMSDYTNKHITFNKGEYIGHLESPIDETPQSSANPDSPSTHKEHRKNDGRNDQTRYFQTNPS